jgi:hypothetical protein
MARPGLVLVAALAVTIGCSDDEEPVATSTTATTTESAALVDVSGSYTCGPTDGTAVEAQVEAREGHEEVVVALLLDGETLGESEQVALEPGAPSHVLFDVALRTTGDEGRVARLVVRLPDGSVAGSADLLLQHRPGGGCG